MAINIYDYRSLTNAVNKVKTKSQFLLDLFFSGVKVTHPTDSFDFEVITGTDKVASFSSSSSQTPKSVGKTTRATKSMSIPRTYEEKGFSASDLNRFKYSNDGNIYIGSTADIASAASAAVLQEVAELKERVMGRRELMAAEAIVSGLITIVTDGNTKTCDFGYANTTNLVTLSGNDKWDASSTRDIIGNLRTWRNTIRKRTGYNKLAVVLGSDAAANFIKDDAVMKALNNLNYKAGQLDLNAVPQDRASLWLGSMLGMDFYEYAQQYTDSNGATQEIFAADRVVIGAVGNANNRMHFGPIVRMGDNGSTLTFVNELLLYPVVNNNKTGVSWELDQKSIPAIHETEAFMSIEVL